MLSDGIGQEALDEKLGCQPSLTNTNDVTLVEGQGKDIEAGEQPSRSLSWVSRWLSKATEASSGQSRNDRITTASDAYSIETKNLETSPGGYARIALLQSSDRNFLQYRGFKELHCRVLSDLQYNIERLEQDLDIIDRFDDDESNEKGYDERRLKNKKFDERQSPKDLASGRYPDLIKCSRPQLLSMIKSKLLEYDEFLLNTRNVYALHVPSKRDYESVRGWFRGTEPIVRREAQFIRRKEDIITLRIGRECAGFDGFIERVLGRADKFLQNWFRVPIIRYLFLTPELREKCKNDDVRYYSPSRIDTLVNVIITVVIFVLLILPVVILYELTDLGSTQTALDAIGVLVVFTLIFGMAISSLTTARRQELFGACAAYCAVLVVFISNFSVQEVRVKGHVLTTMSRT